MTRRKKQAQAVAEIAEQAGAVAREFCPLVARSGPADLLTMAFHRTGLNCAGSRALTSRSRVFTPEGYRGTSLFIYR